RYLRPGYRLFAVARPHHRQPSRLRTGRYGDLGCGRGGGPRAGDDRLAGRRSFGGFDDRGATTAAQRTLLRALETPGAGATEFRQSRRVLWRGPDTRLA